MIVGFRHKGLRRLFERGDAKGIRPDLLDKVRTILAQLSEAETIGDMSMTSFHLHPLKGDMRGHWSVTVRANWRIVFRFVDGDADAVDLIDYH
jgi:proteic killer suppression protein